MEGDDALPADAVIIIAVQGPSGSAVLCLSEHNHFPPVSEALRWEEAGVCLGCAQERLPLQLDPEQLGLCAPTWSGATLCPWWAPATWF